MPRRPTPILHLPTEWQTLAFVEEPRYGRVIRIEQRTLRDGTREVRRVDVTRERSAPLRPVHDPAPEARGLVTDTDLVLD